VNRFQSFLSTDEVPGRTPVSDNAFTIIGRNSSAVPVDCYREDIVGVVVEGHLTHYQERTYVDIDTFLATF